MENPLFYLRLNSLSPFEIFALVEFHMVMISVNKENVFSSTLNVTIWKSIQDKTFMPNRLTKIRHNFLPPIDFHMVKVIEKQ